MAEKSRMTWEEFAREHPEYTRKKKKTMQNKKLFCSGYMLMNF